MSNHAEFDLYRLARFHPQNDITQMKEYIESYFIPLNNGDHLFKENGKWEIIEDKKLKTYTDRMPKDLQKWYFKERKDLRRTCCKFDKPEFFEENGGDVCE
jgi:hypothetical protein